MEAETFVRRMSNADETEIEWTLRNVTNDMLIGIIVDLLALLREYQVKCNDKK
jgi:hypothetical protein